MTLTWIGIVGGALILSANGLILLASYFEYSHQDATPEWIGNAQFFDGDQERPLMILLHGFGGSPLDLKPLALQLAAKGYRVSVPVLPYQTRRYFAYGRGKWDPDSMVEFARALAAKEIAATGLKPVMVGFSMGGSIATAVCAEGVCSKLVLIAPFFDNPLLCRSVPIIKFMFPVVPKLSKGQINDKEGYSQYEPGSYLVSMFSFESLCHLAKWAVEKLEFASTPTLVFGAPGDAVASYAATERLFAGRKDSRLIKVASANHILLFDYGRSDVIESILEFISRPNRENSSEK